MKFRLLIKEMELENEYVLVDKDDDIVKVSKALAYGTKKRPKNRNQKQPSILAAYVMDGKKPIGIISKEDIIEKAVLENKDLTKTKAKDIMTAPFLSVDINDDVQVAFNIILEKNFLTVPILEEEELKGVFTVFDALWALKMDETSL
ncbi:MAG: CBS domain-containing protein [Candidatus Helarchaeota archaeon]